MLKSIERHYKELDTYEMLKDVVDGVVKISLKKKEKIDGVVYRRGQRLDEDRVDGTKLVRYAYMYTEPWALGVGDVVRDNLGYYRVVDLDDLMGKGSFFKYYLEEIDVGGVDIG